MKRVFSAHASPFDRCRSLFDFYIAPDVDQCIGRQRDKNRLIQLNHTRPYCYL